MSKSSRGGAHKTTGEFLGVHEAAKAMMLPKMGRSSRSVSYFAAVLNVPESTLYQWGDGRIDMPASAVVPLTLAANDFLMLDEMERAVGRVAIPLPTGEDLELGSVRRVMRECSEAVETACRALEDGKLTMEESDSVEREALQGIAALHVMISEFKARAEGEARPAAGVDVRASTLAAAERKERG